VKSNFFYEEFPIKYYHNKYLIIVWIFSSIILYNLFVSDILSSIVSKKESRIETFKDLIERTEIEVLVVENSNAYNFIKKVIFNFIF
jgi:hypothetical protein